VLSSLSEGVLSTLVTHKQYEGTLEIMEYFC
jgi:hypothetical protein